MILLLFQFVVNLIGHRLQPFVTLLATYGHVCSEMLEPGVTLCAVPVLHFVGDVDNHAGRESDGRLSPLLVPASTRNTDEYLVCAVMDVPVISTARLKGDIGIISHGGFTLSQVYRRNGSQVAVSYKVLSVCIVGITLWPVAGIGICRTIHLTIAICREPFTEFVHLLLGVSHIHGSRFVGCQLRFHAFQTAEGSHCDKFAVSGR